MLMFVRAMCQFLCLLLTTAFSFRFLTRANQRLESVQFFLCSYLLVGCVHVVGHPFGGTILLRPVLLFYQFPRVHVIGRVNVQACI